MIHLLKAITLLAMLPAAAAIAEPFDFTRSSDVTHSVSGDDLVHATLIPDHHPIEPGETFLLAVELSIQPGWHVYWKNPGDSGLPTLVDWKLPDGFKAGPLHWPVPLKLTEPGGITTYGYENTVTLIAPITAPQDIEHGDELTLAADVSWLVCKQRCLPGSAVVSTTCTVGQTPDHPSKTNPRSAWNRMPARTRPPFRIASVNVEQPGQATVKLHWTKQDAGTAGRPNPIESVDLYPVPSDRQQVNAIDVRHDADLTTITVAVSTLGPNDDADADWPLRALVVWKGKQAKTRGGAYLDVPLSTAAAAP